MSTKYQPGDQFSFHKDMGWDDPHCVHCGRKMGKDESKWKWITLVRGGFLHDQASGDPDFNDSGYMGSFPIGQDCARRDFDPRVIATFTFTY